MPRRIRRKSKLAKASRASSSGVAVSRKPARRRPRRDKSSNSQLPVVQRVTVPAAYGSVTMTKEAKLRQTKGGSLVVSNREYLQEVSSVISPTFTLTTYLLQPASMDNFPWLAAIGLNYEQYKFIRLRYVFESRASTTRDGRLIIATQLDSKDPVFASAEEMMNYKGAQSCNLWKTITHDCLLNGSNYMQRYFTLADGDTYSALQLYNTGSTSFTVTSNAVAVVYDMFVEYQVEFFNPKRQPSPTLNAGIQYTSIGTVNVPINTSNTILGNSFPVSISPLVGGGAPTETKITFPEAGYYTVNTLSDVVSTTGSYLASPVSHTNCTLAYESTVDDTSTLGHVLTTLSYIVFAAKAGASLIQHLTLFSGVSAGTAATVIISQILRANPSIGAWSTLTYVNPDDLSSDWFSVYRQRYPDKKYVCLPGSVPRMLSIKEAREYKRESREKRSTSRDSRNLSEGAPYIEPTGMDMPVARVRDNSPGRKP